MVMLLNSGGALFRVVSFGVVLGRMSDWKFHRAPGRLSSTITAVSNSRDSMTTLPPSAAMSP